MNGVLTARLGAAAVRMDLVLNGLESASPQTLEECANLTESICQDLAGIRTAAAGTPPHHDPGDLPAALELRAKIRRARQLLEKAYRFHSGLHQLVGVRTGGYLPGGQAAPFLATGRLFIRG